MHNHHVCTGIKSLSPRASSKTEAAGPRGGSRAWGKGESEGTWLAGTGVGVCSCCGDVFQATSCLSCSPAPSWIASTTAPPAGAERRVATCTVLHVCLPHRRRLPPSFDCETSSSSSCRHAVKSDLGCQVRGCGMRERVTVCMKRERETGDAKPKSSTTNIPSDMDEGAGLLDSPQQSLGRDSAECGPIQGRPRVAHDTVSSSALCASPCPLPAPVLWAS